jgi:hypothetical protein
MTQSRFNDSQFSPNPWPQGDRRTNTVELKVADNQVRRGRERVYEGTGAFYEDFAAGGFAEARSGATSSVERPGTVYGKQFAQGRGPVGSGQPMEHWTDEREFLGNFAQGTAPIAAGTGYERPGNIYQTIIAPRNGGRAHRNDAEVIDG